jgi:hypothetical protein
MGGCSNIVSQDDIGVSPSFILGGGGGVKLLNQIPPRSFDDAIQEAVLLASSKAKSLNHGFFIMLLKLLLDHRIAHSGVRRG